LVYADTREHTGRAVGRELRASGRGRARESRAPIWRGNSKAPGLAINHIVSDCTSEEG